MVTESFKGNGKPAMTLKTWLFELFQDERGHVSIKPVIALMGALFLCGTMLASAISHDTIKIADSLIDAVMVITSIGMGADSVDKFSHRKPTPNTSDWEGGDPPQHPPYQFNDNKAPGTPIPGKPKDGEI